MSKISNFNASYVTTTMAHMEGYAEKLHSADRSFIELLKSSKSSDIISNREYFGESSTGKMQYQLRLSLDGGVLNCNQPLPSNTEVKLSFDRSQASVALLYKEYGENKQYPTTLDAKVLDIIDPYLEVEYISSPYLRNFYAQIVDRPITMRYDDCDIYMKTLNQGQSMIRVNNIMGGLTPDYLFAGVVKTDALNGDFLLSSSRFVDVGYKEVCVTLNGMPVQGYPISMDFAKPVKLFSKFMDTIGKTKKSVAGDSIDPTYFCAYYTLISHRFEGEAANEGWIGLDIKLNSPLTEDYTLGKVI